jgi:hypothetical protein
MRFGRVVHVGCLQKGGAFLTEFLELLMSWIGGRRHGNDREVGDRNLDRRDDRRAIGAFGARGADGDLTGPFRLDLDRSLALREYARPTAEAGTKSAIEG